LRQSRRNAQCTDHFAPDVFQGIVVEVETSFYPAIGDAALGDEAPENLFQHPRKVRVPAPVRRDLRLCPRTVEIPPRVKFRSLPAM
jgi:hypothetical protein